MYYLEKMIDNEAIILCKPKKGSKDISQSRRYRQLKNNIEKGLEILYSPSLKVIEREQKDLYEYCGEMFEIKNMKKNLAPTTKIKTIKGCLIWR